MKTVGLIGVPGSGKTELADEIFTHYAVEYDGPIGGLVVKIDGYVESIQRLQGWACDVWGGWIANLSIALTRLEREEYERRSNEGDAVHVTCGTLVDTLAYAALSLNVRHRDAEVSNDDYVRAQNVMHTLGMLFSDTWPNRYDHLFFLFRPDAPPAYAELQDAMTTALDTLAVPYVALPAEDRIDLVTNHLDDEPAAPEER